MPWFSSSEHQKHQKEHIGLSTTPECQPWHTKTLVYSVGPVLKILQKGKIGQKVAWHPKPFRRKNRLRRFSILLFFGYGVRSSRGLWFEPLSSRNSQWITQETYFCPGVPFLGWGDHYWFWTSPPPDPHPKNNLSGNIYIYIYIYIYNGSVSLRQQPERTLRGLYVCVFGPKLTKIEWVVHSRPSKKLSKKAS
jgi:hypothetical protein